MREFSFSITEHDPDRPWIILRQDRRTVELDERIDFHAWAHVEWPPARYTVQLDPWQASPER